MACITYRSVTRESEDNIHRLFADIIVHRGPQFIA